LPSKVDAGGARPNWEPHTILIIVCH
jgi:hypothetical protein